MKYELADNHGIILKWDNSTEARVDNATLRFEACSISEFAVFAEIHLAGQMNFQGALHLRFETCIYAFEIFGFAKRLRLLAAGDVQERMFYGATDFWILAVRDEHVPLPIAELHYEHMRVPPMHSLSTFAIQLGPFSDPIGTANAIEKIIADLQMDCDPFPDHGPLRQ